MATGNQAYNYGKTPIAQNQPQPLNGMAQTNSAASPTVPNPTVTTQGSGWGAQPTVTPGGLHGTSGGPATLMPQGGSGGGVANAALSSAGGGFNAQRQQMPDIGTNQQYIDTAYDSAMRQMQPQMEARNAQIAQGLVNRGLQPGTAAYDAEMDRMNRAENDMLQSAAYGAQQTGLAAQNQEFQQHFGYDQLANALAQSQIGASAQVRSAAQGAGASMGAARLNHELGMARLGEEGRQFDMTDIFRTQGQDQNFLLGAGSLFNNMQNSSMNQFNMQNQANNQWYQQAGQMANNAPGVMFTPQTDYTGNQINANSNRVNAIGQDNAMMAQMLGGGLSMIPSDMRLKENIKPVGKENGVNMYEFDYKDKSHGAGRYRGVMAQEIQNEYPDAIITGTDGYLRVDYSQLPVDMTLLDEVSA